VKLRAHGLDVEFRENLVERIRLRFGSGRRGKSLGAESNRRLIAKLDHHIVGISVSNVGSIRSRPWFWSRRSISILLLSLLSLLLASLLSLLPSKFSIKVNV
jgi:hypothetical protein